MKVETISSTNNIIYYYWRNLFYLGNTLQYPFGVLWIIILTAKSFRKYLTTVKITYFSLYIYYELTYMAVSNIFVIVTNSLYYLP